MKKNLIYILGVGNLTKVYIDIAEECGFYVKELFHYNDEKKGDYIYNIPIIDSNANLLNRNSLKNMQFAVSVGNNLIRSSLSNRLRALGGEIATLIHPSAIVSKYAKISKGVVIQPNAVIQAGVEIGLDTVISYNVSVTHNSIIGKACYLSAGANIGAYVKVGNNVLIGQNATIISGKVRFIGNNSIIGAGSIVTKEVEENSVIFGNPARCYIKNL